jgi:hypothetical protein
MSEDAGIVSEYLEKVAYGGEELATCVKCGAAMVFNVPRLGPSGGYIHAQARSFLCPCPKCGSGRRTALQTHCAECSFEFPPAIT